MSTIINRKKVQLFAFTALGLATAGAAAMSSNTNANADEVTNSTLRQASQPDEQVYTVQAGDTLSAIASKFNTTVDKLQSLNHLQSPDMIYAGSILKVTDADTYTVKTGDTLSSIANAKNTSVSVLRSVNNLTSDLIRVGQVLKLTGSNESVSGSNTHASIQTGTSTRAQTNVSVQSNTAQTNAQSNTTQTNTQTNTTQATSSSSNAAKEWIAMHESSGNYAATNGRYFGRYQLDRSYLHGDYSPANQERVANNYVSSRYGSWENAKSFWQQHGWY